MSDNMIPDNMIPDNMIPHNNQEVPKVWVSGAWIHRDDMSDRITHIQNMGYLITHDWTRVERTDNPTPQELGEYARLDIRGVLESDIAVAVMNDANYSYRGTYTEIGCALGVGKPIHIICPFDGNAYLQSNVFYWHPNITHHRTWEDFVTYLRSEYPINNDN